jgi:hypothetical protein
MTNALVLVVPQPPASEIPEHIQGDRRVIKEAASVIRNLWAQIDNAGVYIAAGYEFKRLHDRLSKNSRHDRKRIGWHRAFDTERFECDRRTAERCIKVFNGLGHLGAIAPSSKLPQGLRALDLLAGLDLSPAVLASYLQSGTVGPNTSAKAIRKLGESLGRPQPKSHKKSKTAGATTVLDKRSWDRKSLEEQQKFLDDIGPDRLCAAMSAGLCDALRNRYADQFARANPRAAASLKVVPRTEVLALPPPDLVADWDLAAAEERRKFAKERGHEFIEAV